jgi:uncharacterized membrane protein YedE/YeeE
MYPGIVLTHFLFGVGLGVVMHRSDFCMAGAFRDLFLTRDFFRMRALILLVAVTSLLLYLGRVSGLVSSYPPSFYGTPSFANFTGGIIFGIGMVLAGGCVIGTFYKMGAGNPVSIIAFAGLLSGSLLFGAVYPLHLSFVEATRLSVGSSAVEHVTGSEALPVMVVVPATLFFLFKGKGKGKWRGNAYARGYLDPWKAAMIISAIIMASFVITGRPLAVTSGYSKIASSLAEKIFPDSLTSLPAYSGEPVRLFYGKVIDRSSAGIDPVVVSQVPLILGIILGAFFSCLTLGEFSLPPLPPKRQAISGFVGGVLMAAGSLSAGGCNVWHIFGGLPVFAFQSILFVGGVCLGSIAGGRLLTKVILNVEVR